jgi:hypothetical protein
LRLLGQHALAAYAVERPVAPDRDQPRGRALRHAVTRPPLGGAREGVLGGLLGEVEVAEEADQGREDLAPVGAEGPFEDR